MDRQAKLTIFVVLVIFCGVILLADWLTRPEPGAENGPVASLPRGPLRPGGAVNISGEIPSLPAPPPPPALDPFHNREDAGQAGGAPGWTPFTHVIKKGDTLDGLARTYYGRGTEWRKIAAANPGLNPGNLKVGQEVKIPPREQPAPASTSPSPTVPAAFLDAPVEKPAADKTAGGKYLVKSGDTLEKIARSELGDAKRWPEIARLNPGLDPAHLKIGTPVVLPEKP